MKSTDTCTHTNTAYPVLGDYVSAPRLWLDVCWVCGRVVLKRPRECADCMGQGFHWRQKLGEADKKEICPMCKGKPDSKHAWEEIVINPGGEQGRLF
jgi:hypothetical protein